MKNDPLRSAAIVALTEIDTPIGTLTALATPRGLAALWFDARTRFAAAIGDACEDRAHPAFDAARRWLDAYWRTGDTARIDIELALDLHGTAFQRAVWACLRAIPQGQTRSYRDLAARAQAPGAARAVGAACAANPVGIIVPCHRVIGARGALTGFAAGLPRKRALLRHEGLLVA